jgi:hypothetical protein
MEALTPMLKHIPIAGQMSGYIQGLRRRLEHIQEILDDLYQAQADERIEALLARPRYADSKRLSQFEHKVFSQMGEDGIIAEIFRRIGTTNRMFVEFAAGDGAENNTLYLLTLGWQGVWIEGRDEYVREIAASRSDEIKHGKLRLLHEFITAENIDALLKKAIVPAEFDLLSIDIDRNDYWTWKALGSYRPRVVVIEYNAIFPPGCQWVVAYAPEATWDGTSNCGASLTALEVLGAQMGYKLVGCNLGGTNAFFVREDCVANHFSSPFTAQNHFEPARYYLARRLAGHPRAVAHIWRKLFLTGPPGGAR